MNPSKRNRRRVAAISTPLVIAGEPGLVSDHDRPEPAPQSTVTELPRIVGRAEPPAPEPELSFDGQLDLRGMSKVRAVARSPLAIVAVVLIVFFVVAVLISPLAHATPFRAERAYRAFLQRATLEAVVAPSLNMQLRSQNILCQLAQYARAGRDPYEVFRRSR